jgi:hypothetical protein
MELYGLSTAATAALRNFDTDFASQERGGVHNANDRTTDSRANHFVQWLDQRWFDQRGITSSDLVTLLSNNTQVVKLITAFGWDVKQGNGI